MVWILRLVSVGADGEEHGTDVMRIARSEDLTDLASLGLTLAEGKRLLAGVQREVVAAQARLHAARRPACRGCGAACRVKDYRRHAIATLFGQVGEVIGPGDPHDVGPVLRPSAPRLTSLTIQATLPLPQRKYRPENTSSGLAPPISRQSQFSAVRIAWSGTFWIVGCT